MFLFCFVFFLDYIVLWLIQAIVYEIDNYFMLNLIRFLFIDSIKYLLSLNCMHSVNIVSERRCLFCVW